MDIDQQIKAVEGAALGIVDEPGLAAVLKTLRWLKANRTAVLQAHKILQHPAVTAIKHEFPDATVEIVEPD